MHRRSIAVAGPRVRAARRTPIVRADAGRWSHGCGDGPATPSPATRSPTRSQVAALGRAAHDPDLDLCRPRAEHRAKTTGRDPDQGRRATTRKAVVDPQAWRTGNVSAYLSARTAASSRPRELRPAAIRRYGSRSAATRRSATSARGISPSQVGDDPRFVAAGVTLDRAACRIDRGRRSTRSGPGRADREPEPGSAPALVEPPTFEPARRSRSRGPEGELATPANRLVAYARLRPPAARNRTAKVTIRNRAQAVGRAAGCASRSRAGRQFGDRRLTSRGAVQDRSGGPPAATAAVAERNHRDKAKSGRVDDQERHGLGPRSEIDALQARCRPMASCPRRLFGPAPGESGETGTAPGVSTSRPASR